MPKYLSGRVKRTPQGSLTTDRYRYLGLDQTEPNLGDPANPLPNIPSGTKFQIVGLREYPGERYWSPIQGGIQPGSITVREEGVVTPPNGISSVTDVNFKGAALTVEGFTQPNGNPGTAVTVTVAPPGTDHGVLFNDNGEFATSPFFTFDNSIGIGSVGIGTSTPSQSLHVVGNLRLEKTIYGEDNLPGDTGNLLVKTVTGGVKWVNQSAVEAGAGGTFGQIQYHGPAGLIDGASNFVFDYTNNRVGIGTTQPELLLDVKGNSKFTGFTTFTNDVRFNSNVSIAGTLTYEDVTNVDAVGLITARAGIRVLTNGIDVDSGGINVDAGGLNVTGITTLNGNAEFKGNLTTFSGSGTGAGNGGAPFAIWAKGNNYLWFSDDTRILLGYDQDLEIKTSGGESIIRDTRAGAAATLAIGADRLILRNKDGNEPYLEANDNGSVKLYHDFFPKFETSGIGATVYGRLDTTDLSVAGVVTSNLIPSLTNNFDLGSSTLSWRNLYVTNLVSVDRIEVQSLKVTGLSTFVGVVTTSSDLYVGGNLYGDDATNISGINSVTATEYYGTGGTGSKLFVPDEDENLIAGNNAGIGITAEGTGPNFSACYNLLLGCNAGRCITIGDYNIAMGQNAGSCLTTAANNVLIGRDVGMGLSTGGGASENVMIGRNTGKIPYGENNVFLGFHAGQCISKANNSVFIGQEAGRGPAVDATSAGCNSSNNVFIGYRAGRCYRGGSGNVVLGSNAATNVCAGSYNFFALNCSARYHCSGSNNIAIGQYAMFCGGNHAGDGQASGNILLGAHTGCFISNADNNTFIGQSAGRRICTGCNNIALGTNALTYATTSSQNIALGNNSLLCNISGTNNIALGQQAARCQVSGCGNITFGNRVGFAATDGDNNILMGCCTARLMTCGNRNIILGCCAGANLTSGNDNVFIGCKVQAPLAVGDKQFAIGFCNNYWITGNSARDIGIGHTLPESRLDVFDGTTCGNCSLFILRSNRTVTRDKKFEVFSDGDTFIKGQVAIGTETVGGDGFLTVEGTASLDNRDQTVMVRDSNDDDAAGRGGNIGFGAYVNGTMRSLAAVGGIKYNPGNDYAGSLAFYTRTNGGNLTERLRIAPNGRIGIGVTIPDSDATIHIVGPDNRKIVFEDSVNLRRNYIGIQDSDNLVLAADEDNLGTDSSIRFRVDETEKLRITADGDLLRGGTGQDIGSSGSPWDKVYANEFIGQINTTQENVTTGNLKVNGIGTFVGNVEFQGDVSIGGTLTYEDVANIDAVGMVTARSGIDITGGGLNVVGVSTFSSDLIIPEFIYHAGDLNTKFGFPADDTISFETAGSERLRIDDGGSVRIGDNASYSAANGSQNLIVGSLTGGNHGISIITGSGTNTGSLSFGDSVSGNAGAVSYNHNDNSMRFRIAGATKLFIKTNGYVGIGTTIPEKNLHVVTDASNATPLLLDRTTTNNVAIQYRNSTSSMFAGLAGDALGFGIDDDANLGVEPMFFVRRSDGRVGIATISPFAPLDVYEPDGTNVDIFSVRSRTGAFAVQCSDATAANPTWALRTFAAEDLVLSPGGNADVNEKVRIKANTGNVGFNQTDPYYKLHLNFTDNTTSLSGGSTGNWGGNGIRIENDSTTAGAMSLIQFRVHSADWHIGNKFISSSPDKSDFVFLHEGTEEALRIKSDGNVHIGGKLGIGVNAGSPSYQLQIHESVNTAYAANATIAQLAVGNVNSSSATNAAGIHLFTDGNGRGVVNLSALNNSTNASADFVIQTRHSATLAERLRISSDGNVGIGTNNPLSKLHVTSATHGLVIDDRHASGDQGLVFTINGDANYKAAIRMTATGSSKGLRFMTGGFTNSEERVRIDSSGNVNIGGNYTQTTDKFQVTGNAKINGNLSVTGVLSYDDVTNIDSIGIITARDGINVSGGGINVTGISTFNDDVRFADRILVGDTAFMSTQTSGVVEVADSNGGKLVLRRDDTSISSSNSIGRIEAMGNDPNANEERVGAVIAFSCPSGRAWSADDYPTNITFASCKDGSGTRTTSLFINAIPADVKHNVLVGGSSGSNMDDYYLGIRGNENTSDGDTTNNVNFGILNQSQSANARSVIDFRLGQASFSNTTSVRLTAGKMSGWNNTTSTRDGYFAISVSNNATLTERLRIDNAGRVRIANTNFNAASNADELVLGTTSGNRGLTVVSGNTGIGALFFADDGQNNIGSLVYEHNTDQMRINVNGSQVMRLDYTSVPTWIYGNDLDTFTSLPAADTIAFTTGGTERLRIASDGVISTTGNVGIGTDNAGRPLTIRHSDPRIRLISDNTGSFSEIYTDDTGHLHLNADQGQSNGGSRILFNVDNVEKVRITADGDLLRGGTGQDIGSASATWDKIYANEFIGQVNTIQENITVNNLFVSGISTFVGVATFSSVGIGSAPTDFLTSDFVVGDGQSSSGMTIYSDGTLGQILFADGNTSNDRQRGKIVYDHSNDSMQFATNAGTKVTIESGGDVGIGTDNPDADLHISSSNPDIKLQDTDGSLQFSQIVQQGANLKVRLRDGSNDGGLAIQGYGGASVTNFVNINGSAGSVGIGTDSIQQKLTVQDSIQLRSTSANTILFFQRVDTGANGWIGIPEWNDDALYIYGPTSNSNEVAASYTQGDWLFYTGGNQSLKIKNGGSVNIGGDYSQTTDKLQVTGNAKINGNLTVTGALTYDDVTNIDSIGIITARNGIHVTGGRVGIGTTTPTYDLEVSNGRAWFKPNETGAEAVALSLGRYSDVIYNGSFYDIKVKDAGGDNVTHLINRYQANYLFNRVSPYGEQRAVRLYSITGGGTYVGIYNTMGSDMNVKLHGNAISYINNDSHFGIGTSNPSTRLHLKGDGTSTSGLMFENSFDKFREYFDGNTDNSDFVLTYESTGNADLRFKADGDVVLNESGNGNVGIRNSNPSYDLHVTGTVAATNFDSLSDRKHKKNIQVIENPIEKIMKIDGVSFDWKETNESSLGVIADNVQEVLPEIVSGEDTKSVNYNGLIGLLIEVVKDQQKQIDELRGLLDK